MKRTLRKTIAVSLQALLIATPAISQQLDRAYHNLEEIEIELFHLSEEYSELVELDSIGYSSQYELPIWMVKISDNPRGHDPEPALLFIGQVHAEEVIGVELVLELMNQLLERHDEDEFRQRLEGLELFFIPTANPEGLEVVHSDLDVTFRKNCRDNIGDGEFRYRRGIGGDTSGVDLNRNYGLHWDRGDTLFQQGHGAYNYNFYRGPEPFSEPEVQALVNLARRHRFLYSVCYHSSRSGENAEFVIAPWYWDGRYPLDRDAIDALGDTLAAQIPTTNGDQSYDFVHATQRVGQAQDWFYQATGSFMYLIELGSEIQPDSTGMREVVEANLDAAFFLMDLALGEMSLPGYGTLVIEAKDVISREPVEAVISIEEFDSPLLEPRRTSALNGRFYWTLPVGEYNIAADRHGYRTTSIRGFEVSEGQHSLLRAFLRRLEPVTCRFQVRDFETGNSISAHFVLMDDFDAKWEFDLEDGEIEFEFPPGTYHLELISEGYVPITGRFDLEDDFERAFLLNPSEEAYREDFSADREWQRGGDQENWGITSSEARTVLTESPEGAYPNDMNTWLLLETGVEIEPDYPTVIELVHRPYFEPGQDSGMVEIYDPDVGDWAVLTSYSCFPNGWDTTRLNVDFNQPSELLIRLRATSDDRLDEDGWLIDALRVYKSTILNEAPPVTTGPEEFRMFAYPNPVNNAARVVVQLPFDIEGTLYLHDCLGRKALRISEGLFSAGKHQYIISGSDLTSGLYYLNFKSSEQIIITRLTFIK